MADRHTIVVRIKGGQATKVLFCDCCPGLTLEVRTYTDDELAVVLARPVWYMEGGDTRPAEFRRDELGVYRATFHEPDAVDE